MSYSIEVALWPFPLQNHGIHTSLNQPLNADLYRLQDSVSHERDDVNQSLYLLTNDLMITSITRLDDWLDYAYYLRPGYTCSVRCLFFTLLLT